MVKADHRSKLIVARPAAQRLHNTPPLLRLDPPLARAGFGFRRTPRLRTRDRLSDQRHKPLAGGFAVLQLRAERPAVDEETSVGRETVGGQGAQPPLHVVWQGRAADVESQLDSRRHLVDVLSTRSSPGSGCA